MMALMMHLESSLNEPAPTKLEEIRFVNNVPTFWICRPVCGEVTLRIQVAAPAAVGRVATLSPSGS